MVKNLELKKLYNFMLEAEEHAQKHCEGNLSKLEVLRACCWNLVIEKIKEAKKE